uniref:Uncharacterized protein n=1 Tax=Arundo donax TaxID=35708 RepID=A0A0A9FVW4_ARUDO
MGYMPQYNGFGYQVTYAVLLSFFTFCTAIQYKMFNS